MGDCTYQPVYNEEEQMNLLEFFRKYKHHIRQLLIITEGHYGLTNYDDLANDQILRVAAYTKQRRLLAKENKVQGHGKISYVSIPIDVPYMFKVVRGHDKVEEPAKLSDIIKTHKYPIMIQFARKYSEIRIGGGNEPSTTFASFLLIKEYEENFLCYHFVDEGKMAERINLAALSTNISCTLVTGEKHMTKKEFHEHLATMDHKITHTTYDRSSGNPEITRITDEGTGTGNPIPDLHPPLLPKEDTKDDPGPPPAIPPRLKSLEFEDSDDDDYEPPPVPVDCKIQPKRPPKQTPPKVPRSPIPSRGILPPKKKSYENTKLVVPPMPQTQEPDTAVYSVPDTTEDDCGENYVVVEDTTDSETLIDGADEASGTKSSGSSAKLPQREWLDNLSVSGVSDVLKKLHLGKYVDKFQDDMVSGSILSEYDEDVLKEEYEFRRVEIIRLMKFIHTGHIPC